MLPSTAILTISTDYAENYDSTHCKTHRYPRFPLNSGTDGLSGELKDLQKNLDEWKQKERSYQERINDEAKELEKISSKQGLLLKKKEEAMKKIRDLGSLPSDAFDKYQVG